MVVLCEGNHTQHTQLLKYIPLWGISWGLEVISSYGIDKEPPVNHFQDQVELSWQALNEEGYHEEKASVHVND